MIKIDEIEYIEFLANYDPRNYYPVLPSLSEEYIADFDDKTNSDVAVMNYYFNMNHILYNDTRNRSFAV